MLFLCDTLTAVKDVEARFISKAIYTIHLFISKDRLQFIRRSKESRASKYLYQTE